MKKRGVVEVQFNWIFILIAGGLILFFFISLISKQSKIAETSSNIDVLEYLDKIISGTSMEVGTTRNVTINNMNIKVTESLVTLADKKIEGKSLRNKIVFAPDAIKGNKLITHSLYWECPYKVTPFLYLTSNEVRYIVIKRLMVNEEDLLANETYDLIPEFTTKEIIQSSGTINLLERNNYEVKLILINQEPTMEIEDTSESTYLLIAINIIPLDDSKTLDGYGQVNFYKRQGTRFVPSGTSYYLKKESLLGAIISDNPEYYEQNMRKALLKLNSINNISHTKELNLKEYCINHVASGKCHAFCPSSYDATEINLLKINTLTKIPAINAVAFSEIYLSALNITLENQVFQSLSCPKIY